MKAPLARAPAPSLKRIRVRHHRAAQMLAQGMRVAEVAALTGYSKATLYRLSTQDPAFRELIEHYRGVADRQYVDLHRMMADLSEEVVEELTDRVRSAPEELSTKDLMELLRTLADRTGHGPTRKEEKTVAFRGLAQAMAEIVDGEVIE